MIRIVIDTNLYISALINENSRNRLGALLDDNAVEILVDATLLLEIQTVIARPKFSKYVSPSRVDLFLELLSERSTFIQTTSSVRHSTDPKDDFLLAICLDGSADYLLTGDKPHLLALNDFGKTKIVTLTQFLSRENKV